MKKEIRFNTSFPLSVPVGRKLILPIVGRMKNKNCFSFYHENKEFPQPISWINDYNELVITFPERIPVGKVLDYHFKQSETDLLIAKLKSLGLPELKSSVDKMLRITYKMMLAVIISLSLFGGAYILDRSLPSPYLKRAYDVVFGWWSFQKTYQTAEEIFNKYQGNETKWLIANNHPFYYSAKAKEIESKFMSKYELGEFRLKDYFHYYKNGKFMMRKPFIADDLNIKNGDDSRDYNFAKSFCRDLSSRVATLSELNGVIDAPKMSVRNWSWPFKITTTFPEWTSDDYSWIPSYLGGDNRKLFFLNQDKEEQKNVFKDKHGVYYADEDDLKTFFRCVIELK